VQLLPFFCRHQLLCKAIVSKIPTLIHRVVHIQYVAEAAIEAAMHWNVPELSGTEPQERAASFQHRRMKWNGMELSAYIL
jgi:hypothetical protein